MPQAAIKLLQDSAADLQAIVDVQTFLFGSNVWLKSADQDPAAFSDWLDAFDDLSQGNTIEDASISDSERVELLSMTLPHGITATDVHQFLDRWNRSINYWAAGKYKESDLNSTDNQDFLQVDVWTAKLAAANAVIIKAEASGFNDPGEMAMDAIKQVKQTLEQGDQGVCAQVRVKIDQEAVMTRSAFLGSLEIRVF